MKTRNNKRKNLNSLQANSIFSKSAKKTEIKLSLVRQEDLIQGSFKINTSTYDIQEKIEAGYLDKIKAIVSKGIEAGGETLQDSVIGLDIDYDIYELSLEEAHLILTQSWEMNLSRVKPHINDILDNTLKNVQVSKPKTCTIS